MTSSVDEQRPAASQPRRIALIAHNNRKGDPLEWARFNRSVLQLNQLFAAGTTGSLLASACNRSTADVLISPPRMATSQAQHSVV